MPGTVPWSLSEIPIVAHTIPFVLPFAEIDKNPPGEPPEDAELVWNGEVLNVKPLNLYDLT